MRFFRISKKLFHGSIDKGAEGFHYIVCEAKGIVPPMMEYAEGGVQASGNKGTGDGGTDDCVAVVEGGIEEGFALGIALVASGVTIREHGGPVDTSSLSFVIIGVAGAHGLSKAI